MRLGCEELEPRLTPTPVPPGPLLDYARGEGYVGDVYDTFADVNGDGPLDHVLAGGFGNGPRVIALDGRHASPVVLSSFFAYEPEFRGGVNVVALYRRAGPDRIAAAPPPGSGGGPVVAVYDGVTGEQLNRFFAFDESFRGGVRLNAADLDADGDADLSAMPGPGGGPVLAGIDPDTGADLFRFHVGDPADRSGGYKLAPAGMGGRYPLSAGRLDGRTAGETPFLVESPGGGTTAYDLAGNALPPLTGPRV